MIFVDTSFFLALAQSGDALHTRASMWAKTIAEPLLLTEYILWETINALSKPIDRLKAHRIMEHVQSSGNYEIIPASSDLFEAGLSLHARRSDKEWSLTDCISFVLMKQRNIARALTHDRHFEQAGFEALLRREP